MSPPISFISRFSKENFAPLSSHSKVFVLVDENTSKHCYDHIRPWLPAHTLIRIAAGESFKTLETCQTIWQALTDGLADRKSVLLNLGGGVVCDMGGFSAAAYKRGIAFWHIPTTLLAQVDAAYGGKLGIDFQGLKNHLGFFKMPNQILLWPGFLETLPKREMRSGFAEMLKHAMISSRERWQKLISKPWGKLNIQDMILDSAQVKLAIIEQDPYENAQRKALNWGHTIGHAVETHSLLHSPDPLLHGEAIAIGMVAEAYLSHHLGSLTAEDLRKITQVLKAAYGQCTIEHEAFATIAELALQDKKNQNGQIKCIFLDQIGHAKLDQNITQNHIIEALAYYTNESSLKKQSTAH